MKKYIFAFYTLMCFFFGEAKALGVREILKVEIGPFDAATAELSYQRNGADYNFSSFVQTTGMFDVFYSFQALYQTKGQMKNGRFVATDYAQETLTSAHKRTKRLLFDQDDMLYRRESSKDNKKKMVDIVVPDMEIDAFDIQTVLMMLVDHLQKTNMCALEKTVFNGKKIYRLTVKDSKTNEENQEELQKCEVMIHQENAEKGDLLWQVSSERFIDAYFSKTPKGLLFLKKLEINSTPLGKLEAVCQKVEEED